MLNSHRNLALAITEQGITAAEVGASGQRRTVLHAAELAFSAQIDLDHPERLGKELRHVLRQNGLKSSRCVIGLAAAWIASRERTVPATDADSLRGVLSIAAEREFASGPQDLLFDYVATPSDKGLSALLAAAPRRVIEQVMAMAKAAGLSVAAITSSAAALATATKGASPAGGRVMLCLLSRGVELTVQSPGGFRLIRHLPVRVDQPQGLAELSGELRRVLSLAAPEHDSGPPAEVLVWDSIGMDPAAADSLRRSLSLPARLCTMSADLDLAAGGRANGSSVQAVALACCAGQGQAIDFLHSRLRPPRTRMIGRRVVWASAAAAVLLAAGLYFVLDWRASSREVADLQNQLDGLKDGANDAKALVEKVAFARGWYDRRPPFLSCLREITAAFPQDGRIWATSLTIEEDMHVTLVGKSLNKEAVLEVRDRLSSNPRLADVKQLYIRQAGGASRDEAFGISLVLKGAN
jgi:hypothetical protein